MQRLNKQLTAAELRADEADAQAAQSHSELANWRQLQGEVARTLQSGWESKQQSVDPTVGHTIPRFVPLNCTHPGFAPSSWSAHRVCPEHVPDSPSRQQAGMFLCPY
jgi:hypothetical protein